MLLSALCCNCRVHCDLRHGSCELLCLGGLRNPHRANLTLVGVVLSHELSFHFYFSIFLALMVGIGKLRVASWIIEQRTNKRNARGWSCLFCYLKDIWSIWWFFRLNLSAEEWKALPSAPTHINRPANCVVPHFTVVVWGRKSPAWMSGFECPCALLTREVLMEEAGLHPDRRAHRGQHPVLVGESVAHFKRCIWEQDHFLIINSSERILLLGFFSEGSSKF